MVSAWWLLVATAVGVFTGVFLIAIVTMLPADLDSGHIQRRKTSVRWQRLATRTFKRH